MYNIKISEEIKKICPSFKGVAVYAEVINTTFSKGLWEEIDEFTQELTSTTQTDDIKLQYAIAATREAYKLCGKDPSRYSSFCRGVTPTSDEGNCSLSN